MLRLALQRSLSPGCARAPSPWAPQRSCVALRGQWVHPIPARHLGLPSTSSLNLLALLQPMQTSRPHRQSQGTRSIPSSLLSLRHHPATRSSSGAKVWVRYPGEPQLQGDTSGKSRTGLSIVYDRMRRHADPFRPPRSSLSTPAALRDRSVAAHASCLGNSARHPLRPQRSVPRLSFGRRCSGRRHRAA